MDAEIFNRQRRRVKRVSPHSTKPARYTPATAAPPDQRCDDDQGMAASACSSASRTRHRAWPGEVTRRPSNGSTWPSPAAGPLKPIGRADQRWRFLIQPIPLAFKRISRQRHAPMGIAAIEAGPIDSDAVRVQRGQLVSICRQSGVPGRSEGSHMPVPAGTAALGHADQRWRRPDFDETFIALLMQRARSRPQTARLAQMASPVGRAGDLIVLAISPVMPDTKSMCGSA